MTRRFLTVTVTSSLLAVLLSGCGDDDVLPPDVSSPVAPSANVDRFELAWENFSRIAEYPPDTALKTTVERLNQWSLVEPFQVAWKPDPLLRTVPATLLESSRLSVSQRLKSPSFFESDGAFLHEALLMRETSRFIVGDEADALQQAKRLFDWTIRNIQLDPTAIRLWPRENLLLGRAASLDREWVFMMLARQQRLDVVWLAVPEAGTNYRLWCPALFHEGELYLFDLLWGSMVPTADGQGIATLSAAAADETLLPALDVPGKPYPVTAAELEKVVVLIAAREPFLSRRMLAVEERLPTENRPVLHMTPSKLAAQIGKSKHVASVQLWTWPYEYAQKFRDGTPAVKEVEQAVMRQMFPFYVPHIISVKDKFNRGEDGQNAELVQQGYETTVWPMWSGRLHHLAGRFEPATNDETRPERQAAAIRFYLMARSKLGELEEMIPDQQAIEERLNSQQLRELQRRRHIYARLNKDATYWLGLIRYEQRDYATAADFFRRTIDIIGEGTEASVVRYNLGRAYEELHKYDEAIEQYRLDRSPASLLLIRQIESRTKS